jgi:hypothetical protein
MNNENDTLNYTYTGEIIPEKKHHSTLSVVSMVFGICSLFLCCCCAGVSCGVVALILAIVDRVQEGKFSGYATAGLICGIIGIVLGMVMSIVSIVFADVFAEIMADPAIWEAASMFIK